MVGIYPLEMLYPAPQPSKLLVVAVSSAPKSLDPALATDAAGARLLQLTNPALLKIDSQFQPTPLVAERCTANTTFTVFTCTLPTGWAFHNGTALTSTEVKGWLEYLQRTPRSPLSGVLADVRMESPTPTLLRFTLPRTTLGFLTTLADIPLAPAPTNDTLGEPRAGLGLYKLGATDTLGSVTLIPTKPSNQPLTFLPLSDPTTRLLKLKRGEVDVVLNDIPPELATWATRQGWNVVNTPSSSYSYLALNFRNEYVANHHIRHALQQAIHTAALRQYLLGGMATYAGTLLPPNHPAAWNAPEPAYNPREAFDALDDMGLVGDANSPRFELTLLTSTDALSQKVAQVIQDDVLKIGIQIKLRPLEWGAFYEALKAGRFDMALASWTGLMPPDFVVKTFHSTMAPPKGMNRGRVNLPQLDAALDNLAAATTPQAQTEAAITAQKLQTETLPYIPLYRRNHILITLPSLTGCTVPMDGGYGGLLTCQNVTR
ncbi:MAG: ABC transporter substrate-binding protein [Alphaproteobacteria bacterium]